MKASVIIFSASAGLLLACNGTDGPAGTGTAPIAQDTSAGSSRPLPLANSGLRFDGCYHSMADNIHYLMHFYPEGNVVVINGTDTTGGGALKQVFRQDVPPNMTLGLHNVPIDLTGDSIHFVTKAMRGTIEYFGKRYGPDTIQMLKRSHINGRQAVFTYLFEPDGGS